MPAPIVLPCITIKRINVQRDDWCAVQATVDEGPPNLVNRTIKVTGVIPNVKEGDTVEVKVTLKTDARWGDSYQIAEVRSTIPKNAEHLARYLAATLPGIGPVWSRKITDAFRENTVAALDSENAVERLIFIGLHQDVAVAAIQTWQEHRTQAAVEMILHDSDFGPTLVARVKSQFQDTLADVLKETPYRLMEVRGVGFKKADVVALRMGIAPDDVMRLHSGAAFVALDMSNKGHCWHPRDDLLREASTLLRQPTHKIADALTPPDTYAPQLVVDEQGRIWPRVLYRAEEDLAQDIVDRLVAPSSIAYRTAEIDYDKVFQAITVLTAKTLTREQQEAVHTLTREKLVIMTGGAGVGKTFVLKTALAAFHSVHIHDIALAAPTGKAAKRMTEVIGHQASTVHSLIARLQQRDECGDLVYQPSVVVVDEASMLDIVLASDLFTSIPSGSHLLLVGDPNQLPSVGPGRVLDNLMSAGLSTAKLTQVHRQAEQSTIIRVASVVRDGMQQAFNNDRTGDLFFFETPDPVRIVAEVCRLAASGISQRFMHPDGTPIAPDEIRVIAPSYKHECGVTLLNTELQAVLNPPGPGKAERRGAYGLTLRVGDRMLWKSNNHQLGLVNGDEVYIRNFYEDTDEEGKDVLMVELASDNGPVLIKLDDLDADLGYAMTVHKSQGSQYAAVIVIAHGVHQFMLTRPLIYTAITRAAEKCIVIGECNAFNRGVLNNRDEDRRTALVEKLTVTALAA